MKKENQSLKYRQCGERSEHEWSRELGSKKNLAQQVGSRNSRIIRHRTSASHARRLHGGRVRLRLLAAATVALSLSLSLESPSHNNLPTNLHTTRRFPLLAATAAASPRNAAREASSPRVWCSSLSSPSYPYSPPTDTLIIRILAARARALAWAMAASFSMDYLQRVFLPLIYIRGLLSRLEMRVYLFLFFYLKFSSSQCPVSSTINLKTAATNLQSNYEFSFTVLLNWQRTILHHYMLSLGTFFFLIFQSLESICSWIAPNSPNSVIKVIIQSSVSLPLKPNRSMIKYTLSIFLIRPRKCSVYKTSINTLCLMFDSIKNVSEPNDQSHLSRYRCSYFIHPKRLMMFFGKCIITGAIKRAYNDFTLWEWYREPNWWSFSKTKELDVFFILCMNSRSSSGIRCNGSIPLAYEYTCNNYKKPRWNTRHRSLSQPSDDGATKPAEIFAAAARLGAAGPL